MVDKTTLSANTVFHLVSCWRTFFILTETIINHLTVYVFFRFPDYDKEHTTNVTSQQRSVFILLSFCIFSLDFDLEHSLLSPHVIFKIYVLVKNYLYKRISIVFKKKNKKKDHNFKLSQIFVIEKSFERDGFLFFCFSSNVKICKRPNYRCFVKCLGITLYIL